MAELMASAGYSDILDLLKNQVLKQMVGAYIYDHSLRRLNDQVCEGMEERKK